MGATATNKLTREPRGIKKMTTWNVFNLEFPDWCNELNIAGYCFMRVKDYAERVDRLQHLVNMHSEFSKHAKFGSHEITATVEDSRHEKPVLDWGKDGFALQDIVLLLSLFTERDVLLAVRRASARHRA